MTHAAPAAGEENRPHGVYAAALTPLTEALDPDLELMVGHCRWLLASGCDGLAPLGTTGEANALTVDQRLAIIEGLAAAGVPGSKLIMGTGSCALGDAARLSRAAVAAGAAGVLVLPPFYYKNPSEDGLFRCFAELIERVADPRLRLYLYHFPRMSTVPIAASLIRRLLAAYPGTVAGLKDSSGEWEHTATMCADFPGFNVFAGTEALLLPTLRAGGAGCISATVNVTAPLAAEVARAARENSGEAEILQEALTRVRGALERYPFVGVLKALMARLTGRTEWSNILPPLSLPPAEAVEDLVAELERLERTGPAPAPAPAA